MARPSTTRPGFLSSCASRLGGRLAPAPARDSRVRWRLRPGLEVLEGRALMALSALDPSFGHGGVVLGPVDSGAGPDLSIPAAMAVQPDGKIVVAGTFAPTDTAANHAFTVGATLGLLAVRRYNADGSVDASFGVDGQANIPLGADASRVSRAPHDVVVAPDGSIFLAASLYDLNPYAPINSTGASVVAKLTPGGQLDPTFATGGVFAADGPIAGVDAVALQPDGKVVAEGLPAVYGTRFTVIRLTAAGQLDPTFNATGAQSFAPTAANVYLTEDPQVDGVALNAGGQIYALAGYVNPDSTTTGTDTGTLSRLQPDGTIDASFGVGGTASLAGPGGTAVDFVGLAVQADGRVVVVGNGASGPFLTRYRADGTVDPSFASALTATTPAGGTGGATSAAAPRVAAALVLAPDGSILLEDRSGGVTRYLPDGQVDPTFGVGGTITFRANPTYVPAVGSDARTVSRATNALALTATGTILVAGDATTITPYDDETLLPTTLGSQAFLARLIPAPLTRITPGDYDGDGRADLAAELATFALFAIRHSAGAGDSLQPFGLVGPGQVLPAPGDYDGDGITDVAGYLPDYGVLVYRPSSGGPDVVVPFGIPGAGQTLPAPGDYDGDGRTDVAAYLPSLGAFAYRPSGGGPDVVSYFGLPGAGASIPAPGDYDGDGITDLAVYLPSLGVLAYRPSQLATRGAVLFPLPDVITPFGLPGAGQTIPTPGDYDGDGRTDIAAYLPALGVYAYRPSSGGADVVEPFGLPGSYGSIAAPGDYDGDGRTDVAVYIPRLALFAYRPSSGGADVVESFGVPSTGQTVPASANAAAFGTATPAGTVAASDGAVDALALTDNLAGPEATPPRPKRKRRGVLA